MKRILETLTSKPYDLEKPQQDDEGFLTPDGGINTKDSVLTLSNNSFPLVCTFDRFIELLENSAR